MEAITRVAPLSELLKNIDRYSVQAFKSTSYMEVKIAVEDVMNQLVKRIGEIDPLFHCKLIPSGSTYEGTKIQQPDEFDFMLCLKEFSTHDGKSNLKPFLSENSPGHILVEVTDESMKDITGNYVEETKGKVCLCATKIKEKFYALVNEARQNILWPDDLSFSSSTGSLFASMVPFKPPDEMQLKWKGTLKVNVDVVPSINLEWSPIQAASIDTSYSSYPLQVAQVVQEILQKEGLMAVGRIGPFWRLSWSKVELSLMQYLEETAPNALCCYRLTKYLNETHFISDESPPNITKVTSSYPIKNVLFHIWANSIDDRDAWSDGKLSLRLADTFFMLAKAFHINYLQCFLMPDKNLIGPGEWNKGAAETCEKLAAQINNENLWGSDKFYTDFWNSKVVISVPKPKKKLSDYKIKILNPDDPRANTLSSILKKNNPDSHQTSCDKQLSTLQTDDCAKDGKSKKV